MHSPIKSDPSLEGEVLVKVAQSTKESRANITCLYKKPRSLVHATTNIYVLTLVTPLLL